MKLDKMLIGLIALSVIQTSTIVYLATQLNQPAQQNSLQPVHLGTSTAINTQDVPRIHQPLPSTVNTLDIGTLRQVVQQELTAYFDQNHVPARAETPVIKQSISADTDLDYIERQINLIIAKGEISNKSIDDVTVGIAKLAPSDRRIALSRLANAVNNGHVKMSN